MGHPGGLLRPLGAVLGDPEASWWRLRPFGPRLGALGEGGWSRGRASARHPDAADGRPQIQVLKGKGQGQGDSKVQGQGQGLRASVV